MDHALDPLSDDDVVGVSSFPLAVLWPFAIVSDRCLLSVTMSSPSNKTTEWFGDVVFGWNDWIDVWDNAKKIVVAVRRCYSAKQLLGLSTEGAGNHRACVL